MAQALDTGIFVSNVKVGGTSADVAAADAEWTLIDGAEQDNNWSVQLISGCDITPGVDSDFEVQAGGLYVYRFQTDEEIHQAGLDSLCPHAPS